MIGVEPTKGIPTGYLTWWSADGTQRELDYVYEAGNMHVGFGLATDSGFGLSVFQDLWGKTSTRFSREGAKVTLVDGGGSITDMSEDGVGVGMVYHDTKHQLVMFAVGKSVVMKPPTSSTGAFKSHCALWHVSPRSGYAWGSCRFNSTDGTPAPDPMQGIWSLDTGKLVTRAPATTPAIDVDDNRRLLLQEGATVSLWANRTSTPLIDLVTLTKNQSLLYPRFDAESNINAILTTTTGGKTTWQAVQFTSRT